jgi:thioredoxin reductase (NADPH)
MAQSLEANSRNPPDESQQLTDRTGKLNTTTVGGIPTARAVETPRVPRSLQPRRRDRAGRAAPIGQVISPTPVLFVVDRDPNSLDVLLVDLSRRFGIDFIVRGETSPAVSLAVLEEMAAATEPVALLLVDDAASDFLARAHELHPSAKRVLLVDRDYSSTSPAVQAMTLGRADYHIVRPWADNEMMYRAVSEYLSSWTREQEPSFEEFRIVAAESDSRVLQLRDVMTRFSMPFGFYPIESEAGQRLLEQGGLDATRLPAVVRYDGQVIIDPSLPDLARAIGVSIKNEIDTCDVAIVGAGPAGLTAAVYAASEGLETVLLERGVSGGQAGTSPLIRNYPGFPHGINGGVLMERTCEQAWLMGAHIVFAQQAVALERRGDRRVVRLLDGTELRARAVVIATGIEWRRLGVPRLEALVGSGVFYGAAASESRAMHDQDVFIVGAGNSAGQTALDLAKHARSVTLLVRGDSFARSMSSYLVRAIESTANVIVRHRTEVVDGAGRGPLDRITLADRTNNTVQELSAAALFIMIGGDPHTEWLPDEIARDAQGYLITGRDLLEQPELHWKCDREPLTLETSIPGVFAAGDVRQGSIKRVASGVGEGATVVRLVHEHLREDEPTPVAN